MTEPAAADDEPIIEVEDFSFFYGSKQVLFNIGMTFEPNRVTALIGPSGCGKSTLLRNINRMNDLVPDVRHQGDIRIDGTSLYDPRVEVISLRKRVGMVFQKYNPFPKSIYENIVFPLRLILTAAANIQCTLNHAFTVPVRNIFGQIRKTDIKMCFKCNEYFFRQLFHRLFLQFSHL